jgi:hypothetical protein
VLGVDLHNGWPKPGDLGPLTIPVEKQVACTPPDTLGPRIQVHLLASDVRGDRIGRSSQQIDDPGEGIAAEDPEGGRTGLSSQDSEAY